MLSAAFLVSVFASVVWIFYALANSANGSVDSFVVTTAVVVLPIFILWAIFGYIYQYISVAVLNKNMYSLFKQMKKNQDYSDLIAKVLLDAGEDLKDNILLSKVDVFIADMNELLSDIIKRNELATPEQIDNLWLKVKNGGKWALGKVIVEQYQNQPNLPNRLLQKALHDAMLGGTILEFCSRYQNFVSALEKHDKERLFLNIIETGVLGKVFSILAAPADSIRQNRDLTLARKQISEEQDIEEQKEETKNTFINKQETQQRTTSDLSESARRLFINTFTRKKTEIKETELTSKEQNEPKDPLSLAFAKSFGSEDEPEKEEPRLESSLSFLAPEKEEQQSVFEKETETIEETEEPAPEPESEAEAEKEPELTVPEIIIKEEEEPVTGLKFEEAASIIHADLEGGFTKATASLSDMKQEWEEAKQRDLKAQKEVESTDEGMPEPKISNDGDYSYPFGGWMNADNYK